MPLAYFLTFSTYGTWLHGTEKGLGSVDPNHNEFGIPFITPNPTREQSERNSMTQPAYVLDAPRRDIVRDAIVELCLEKAWNLSAVHVRTNHVHVVIAADRDPARLMSDLKSRASRNLSHAGHDDPKRKRWSRHGSTRHLFNATQVEQKINYTLYEQGPPISIYDGRPEPRTK